MGERVMQRDEEGRFINGHRAWNKGDRLPSRPTKQELEELYWEKKINTPEIAEILEVNKTTVLKWMQEYNIPRRNQGESISPTVKKLWKNPEYRAKIMPHLQECWKRSEERSKNTKQLWNNPQFKAKMSGIHKELWRTPEYRTIISKGRKRMWRNPEYRLKMIKERKTRWSNPEYKQRVIQKSRKSLFKKPTEPEQNVIELIKKYALPFHYTGDGEVIIDGLNPDFIHNNDERKVIEVFGRVFHDPEESFFNISWRQQYWGKILDYKKRGRDCLILWEDEPKAEMLERIREFTR